MYFFYVCILFCFLLFPKIGLNEQTGIMIGEVFLLLGSAFIILFKQDNIKLRPSLLMLLLFYGWFLLGSSLLNGVLYNSIPLSPVIYFIKIVNYFFLFFIAYSYYTYAGLKKAAKIFELSFLVHYIFAMGIVVAYYILNKPSIGDILWNYETGIRAIPLAGLAIASKGFAFLSPIGGGSSNLFVSWALAFAIFELLNPNPSKYRNLWLFLTFLVPLAGMSRGGILTFGILFVYIIMVSKAISPRKKAQFLFASLVVIALVSVLLINSDIVIPNVFERFSNIFSGDDKGTLDPSAQGRFENYQLVYSEWVKNPLSILFGLGMDEGLMKERTGWGLVESFFLQVLFCGGIFGLFLLMLFFVFIYGNRKRNLWFKALWLFIAIESILMWTITGGDFYSPHVMFIIMVFMGFGYAEDDKRKKSLLKDESITVN